MNCQPSTPKNPQTEAERAGSIFKYAGIFEYAKKGIIKGKKNPFFNFIKKRSATSQPKDASVTIREASS